MLELCASVKNEVLWVLAGSLWVPCGSLRYPCGINGVPEQVAWKDLELIVSFSSKATTTSLNHVHRMSRNKRIGNLEGNGPARPRQGSCKSSARKPPGNNKEAAREPQSTEYPQEKNKQDIVRTSARVKPRSLARSTSQVLSEQARCASQRQLRHLMFYGTDQDRAQKFSITTHS